MSAVCSTCRKPITWAVIAKTGRRIPLDPQPSDTGNVVLEPSGFAQPRQAAVLSKPLAEEARAAGTPLYVTHSCEAGA